MGSKRLELTDTTQQAVFKLGEGNPGALRVCCDLLTHGAKIDPQNALGGVGSLLQLDSCGIYGPRIWMLYKDVCGENLYHMVAVLRGWQLGIVGQEELDHAIDNYSDGLDVQARAQAVKERLPQLLLEPPMPAEKPVSTL